VKRSADKTAMASCVTLEVVKLCSWLSIYELYRLRLEVQRIK